MNDNAMMNALNKIDTEISKLFRILESEYDMENREDFTENLWKLSTATGKMKGILFENELNNQPN